MPLSIADIPLSILFAIIAVFLLAGLIKGVVGLGLPTISMALLALFMAPAQAAALLVVPSLLTNLWQAGPWRQARLLLPRLTGLLLGCLVGTLLGSAWLGAPKGGSAALALGLALLAYACWGLSGARFMLPARHEVWAGPLAGLTTGLLTAVSGVFVLPAVPYLQALGLGRDDLVRAMGLAFSVSTLALGAGLWFNASFDGPTLWLSSALLLPAVAGMQLGAVLRARLSPQRFRQCLYISLGLLGAYMLWRHFGGA